MATRASKHTSVQPLSLKFDGGLNYSQTAPNIADNELARALNIVYSAQSGTPEVRPGTTCCMAATCDGSHPLLIGYYYEKTAAVKYHVVVCNGNLYYRSGATLNAWTLIGALNDTTTVPSFLTFNGKLLIADGGTNIKTWDGTTFSALADGLSATALSMIKGRVVANSSTDKDLVTLCKAYDDSVWDTSSGAVAVRAGYGDNMSVNGFAVFGDDLIVSKVGDSEKRLYRLNTADATSSNWYTKELSANNAAQNAHCLISAFNNVFLVDSNGFKSLAGVTAYGDLQVDIVGSKINTLFYGDVDCDGIFYIPKMTALYFCIADRVFAYHRLYDTRGSADTSDSLVKHAFTDLMFEWGRCTSVYQAGDDIFFTGYNGYLYKFDDDVSTDETAPSTTASFISVYKSKQFLMSGDAILRKCQIKYTPLTAGSANLIITTESGDTTLKTITFDAPEGEIYDLTGDLNDWTDYLYSVVMGIETVRNRIRGNAIQFGITTVSGRYSLEGLQAELALVEG